jgi:hypothetical protein
VAIAVDAAASEADGVAEEDRTTLVPGRWLRVVSNELWRVRASVTTVTFELAIDGFGDK